MKRVYEFLANGFEDVEALVPLDVLRRGGVDVKTVSISGSEFVETAHGVTVKADMLFGDADLSDADLLILPGGMPGAANLDMHEGVKKAVMEQNAKGGLIAAICAAPLVFGRLGILKGRRATCYPGFEHYLEGAECTGELCVVDGNVVTGKGPAAAFPFAYRLLAMLTDEATADGVAEGMMYLQLMR